MTFNGSSFKPVIKASPHYESIMADYEKYKDTISKRQLYKDYVFSKDPNIKQDTWLSFVRRIEKKEKKEKVEAEVTKKLSKIPEAPVIQAGTEATVDQLQMNSIEHMITIGNLALQELASNPEAAKKIPVKERVGMLKDAMKIKNDRETLALKRRKDDREQSLFEEIMDAAQYGDVEEEEIIDGTLLPEGDESKEPVAVNIPVATEVLESIVFDPSKL